jgi:hypothetical protein
MNKSIVCKARNKWKGSRLSGLMQTILGKFYDLTDVINRAKFHVDKSISFGWPYVRKSHVLIAQLRRPCYTSHLSFSHEPTDQTALPICTHEDSNGFAWLKDKSSGGRAFTILRFGVQTPKTSTVSPQMPVFQPSWLSRITFQP